jgi:putative heme degradation protein
MPQLSRQALAACPMAAVLPNTLGEMSRVTDVTLLGWDVETLALLGTQFEDALITTRNQVAIISGRGGYAGLQPANRSYNVNARRVNLRYLDTAPVSLARCNRNPRLDQPGALLAVDRNGEVQHRVQFVTDYDVRVAESLDVTETEIPEQAEPLLAEHDNVVPFNAIRSARQSWDKSVAADHLNDFLTDRGCARLKCLRHIGRQKAWRVDNGAFCGFLEQLHHARRDFTRIVCATGLMQAQAGRIERIGRQGSILTCTSSISTFAIDTAEIGSIWVAASRLHWQLEIYDRKDRAVAILTAPPLSCGQDWRNLLLAMPRSH